MAEKRPVLLAEAETPLQVLRKDVGSGAVAKRLGIAFDMAFDSFAKKVKAEAQEYNRTLRSSDPAKIREWALLSEPPRYMKVDMRVSWEMDGKHLKEYDAKLAEAYKKGGMDAVADVVEEAKKEGVAINIVVKAKVSVDSDYLAKVKATKKNFVKNAVVLIGAGVTAGSKIEEPYDLQMGDRTAAKLFMAELQAQVGANKPSGQKGRMQLEKALANKSVIPENHYPLETRVEGTKVIVDWASFITIRAMAGVAMLVPEKISERTGRIA